MITREKIAGEIAGVRDEQLDDLYQVIKDFETRKESSKSQEGVMSRLRKIRISATPAFSMRASLNDLTNGHDK